MHEAVELTVAELAAVELRCKSLQESEAFRSERGSWEAAVPTRSS